MARAFIAPQPAPLATGATYYPATPLASGSAQLVFVAGDAIAGNYTVANGKALLLVRNTDTAPQTVTIKSVGDQYNRTGDITAYQIPAGEVHCFGPFPTDGWSQSSPLGLWFDVSSALLLVCVLQLP